MELGGVPQKLMNISTGDLYSMYVILQRIGSLPCIRVYNIDPGKPAAEVSQT